MTYNFKRFFFQRSIFIYTLFIFLSGCALEVYEPPVYYVSPAYDKIQHQRIGVLVNRMGNIQDNSLFIMPATLSTNYSERIPIPLEFDSDAEPRDVYIGNETRIHESLPNYPDYEPESRFQFIKYFKDITPMIYESVKDTLVGKGYSVINIQQIDKAWPKHFSEMSIEQISEQLKGDVDVLFVMHYMDRGPYLWDSIARKSSATGLTNLKYSISMFDVKSKERVLFVEYEEISPYQAIVGDPEVKANPKLKAKIQGTHPNIKLLFSENEIVDFVVKYMRYGLVYEHYYESSDSFSPVRIKGLNELIP